MPLRFTSELAKCILLFAHLRGSCYDSICFEFAIQFVLSFKYQHSWRDGGMSCQVQRRGIQHHHLRQARRPRQASGVLRSGVHASKRALNSHHRPPAGAGYTQTPHAHTHSHAHTNASRIHTLTHTLTHAYTHSRTLSHDDSKTLKPRPSGTVWRRGEIARTRWQQSANHGITTYTRTYTHYIHMHIHMHTHLARLPCACAHRHRPLCRSGQCDTSLD